MAHFKALTKELELTTTKLSKQAKAEHSFKRCKAQIRTSCTPHPARNKGWMRRHLTPPRLSQRWQCQSQEFLMRLQSCKQVTPQQNGNWLRWNVPIKDRHKITHLGGFLPSRGMCQHSSHPNPVQHLNNIVPWDSWHPRHSPRLLSSPCQDKYGLAHS